MSDAKAPLDAEWCAPSSLSSPPRVRSVRLARRARVAATPVSGGVDLCSEEGLFDPRAGLNIAWTLDALVGFRVLGGGCSIRTLVESFGDRDSEVGPVGFSATLWDRPTGDTAASCL